MTKGCAILLIEDDPAIRSTILKSLEPLGLKVGEEADGISGERRAREQVPALILLDLGLPGMEGLEVLRKLRSWYTGSVIVITAWEDEQRKLEAFELGADDFVSKPFSPRELLARARVALKRSGAPANDERARIVSLGDLEIDLGEHAVRSRAGELLSLTQTEYRFLLAMAHHPGRLVLQGDLLKGVWGPNHAEDTHYLRILVSRLRKKLTAAKVKTRIQTEPGLGYRIQVDEAP